MATFFSYFKKNKIPKKEILSSLLSKPYSWYGIFLYTIIILILIFSYFLIVSINNTTLVTIPDRGGSLTEGVIGSPRFINPVLENTETGKELSRLIYSGLIKKDVNGEIVPDLAESYSISPDEKTYKFILRSKVRFSDGSHLTLDDVSFTISKLKDESLNKTTSSYWSKISVEVNQNEITFTLPEKDTDFLKNTDFGVISRKQFSKIPSEDFEKKAGDILALGAGPFKVVSIKKTNDIPSSLILDKNTHYYEKTNLDGLTIIFFSNQEELVKSIQNGSIDFTMSLSPNNASTLTNKNLSFDKVPTNSTISLFRSRNENLLSDQRFTSILNNFIDRNKIITNVESGYGIAIGNTEPGNLEDTLAKLKALGYLYQDGVLEKKGVQIGFSIAVENNESLLTVARELASNLGELGLIVTVKAYNHGIFQDGLLANEYYIFLSDTPGLITNNYQEILPIYTKTNSFVSNKKTYIKLPSKLDNASDRYNDVNHWYTETQEVWKIFTRNNLLKKLI